jgi:hypothetical protein
MTNNITHDRIMQLAMGFWASKALLSAVEIGVFGAFDNGPLDLHELRARLGLHERAARDFFDALVALGLLQRDDAGRYSNTDETELFLNPARPGYIGGVIEMMNARLYGFWGSLTEALRTGEPQNEAKHGGDLFDALSKDPARLEGFLRSPTGRLGRGLAPPAATSRSWHDALAMNAEPAASEPHQAFAHPFLSYVNSTTTLGIAATMA